jgi:hypothetical protein
VRRFLLLQKLRLGRLLLLQELKQCKPSTDQDHGAADELTGRLAEIVLDIGACLCVSDF